MQKQGSDELQSSSLTTEGNAFKAFIAKLCLYFGFISVAIFIPLFAYSVINRGIDGASTWQTVWIVLVAFSLVNSILSVVSLKKCDRRSGIMSLECSGTVFLLSWTVPQYIS